MSSPPVQRRLRSYLEERASEPIPIGMEQRIIRRAETGNGRAPHRSWFSQAVGAAALIALALGIGLTVFYARTHGSPARNTPPVVTSPTPAPPAGGPAPAELQGQWVHATGASGQRLFIRPDQVVWGGTRIELVVRGNEIDFYNGNACGIRLPGGVGRYRWSISGGLLRFEPLALDPCTDRPGVLAEPFRKIADSG